ncbi:MAG: hypothetical protein K2L64_00965 [Ureaplasma sp.]|nr:hypothetical protein [Ureaplasma sp.]
MCLREYEYFYKVNLLFEYFNQASELYSKYLNKKIIDKEIEFLEKIGINNVYAISKNKNNLCSKLETKFDRMFAFLEVSLGKEKISYTTNCIENGNKIFKSFIRNKT